MKASGYDALTYPAADEENSGANDQEPAIAHANQVTDHIIDKARGILPFNGFVLASIAILQMTNEISKFNFILGLSAIMLSVSSLGLLYWIFLPEFVTGDNDRSLKKKFPIARILIRKRITILHHATLLSLIGFFFCCFAIAAPYFIHLFRDAYIYWIAS